MKLLESFAVRGELLPLERYIDVVKEILREKKTRPIMVDKGGYVETGLEVFNGLKAIGTRLIPVAEDESELSVEVPIEQLGFYDNIIGDPTRVYADLLELLERDVPTPMLRIKSLSSNTTTVWAKLEWYHPLSLSIKDRIAWYMMKHALENGFLQAERVYEATSTNTGLGIVGIANYLGLKTRIYLPATAQHCVDYLFKAMGSEVVRVPTPLTVEAVKKVVEDAKRDNAYTLNQFENDNNFIVHLKYTAKEIDYQLRRLGRRPRAIVSGLGTSGHFSALATYFKSMYGDVKMYGVQPSKDSIIPGLRRVETGMKWIGYTDLDGIIDVSLEEAFYTVIQFARREGLLIGLSGGAVVHAAKKLIEAGEIDGDVVIVIPDHGMKYIELFEYLIEKCVEEPGGVRE